MDIEKLDKNMKKNNTNNVYQFKWYNPKEYPFRVSGFYWFNEDNIYRRLPLSSKQCVREEINHLSNHTAGGQIAFKTNSRKVAIKVILDEFTIMKDMTLVAQCGFDCYINNLFYSTTKFDYRQNEYNSLLFETSIQDINDFTLYFPLYNGVKEILIGIENNSIIIPPDEFIKSNPIVIYGSSIVQGGCASRPGMAYSNILTRRLNIESINLGFSGNAFGEIEIAKIINSIENPLSIILDYEANAAVKFTLENTLEPFINTIREKNPFVPIIVITQFPFAQERFNNKLGDLRERYKKFQYELIKSYNDKGDMNIYLFDGCQFFDDDPFEYTLDGVHPTDLGFYKIANKLEILIKDILEKDV